MARNAERTATRIANRKGGMTEAAFRWFGEREEEADELKNDFFNNRFKTADFVADDDDD